MNKKNKLEISDFAFKQFYNAAFRITDEFLTNGRTDVEVLFNTLKSFNIDFERKHYEDKYSLDNTYYFNYFFRELKNKCRFYMDRPADMEKLIRNTFRYVDFHKIDLNKRDDEGKNAFLSFVSASGKSGFNEELYSLIYDQFDDAGVDLQSKILNPVLLAKEEDDLVLCEVLNKKGNFVSDRDLAIALVEKSYEDDIDHVLVRLSEFKLSKKDLGDLMHIAVSAGYNEKFSNQICKYLLNRGADPDATDYKNETILHKQINIELFNFFVDSGASLDIVNKEGNTPLHKLIKRSGDNGSFAVKDFKKVFSKSLSRMTDVDIKNNAGETILFRACEIPNAAAVKELIKHGADISIKDKEGNSLLHNIFDNVNNFDYTQKELKSFVAISKYLINSDVDFNFTSKTLRGLTPLMYHYVFKNARRFKSDSSKQGQKLKKSGFFDLTDDLIKNVNNLNIVTSRGTDILASAFSKNDVETIDKLIKRGANVNNPKRGSLLKYVFSAIGSLDAPVYSVLPSADKIRFDILKRNGVDFYQEDLVGNNVYHYACGSGLDSYELISKYADKSLLTKRNNDGSTPLDMASNETRGKIESELLSNELAATMSKKREKARI